MRGSYPTRQHQTSAGTVAVTGIATHFCVLTTALDALCHDLRAVILEDCCAAATPEIHQRTLDNCRRNPLYPLLRVMDSAAFLQEIVYK